MSVHDAVEIQQREADLKKSLGPRLIGPVLYVFSMLILLGVITNTTGGPYVSRDAYPLFLISGGGLYLAFLHHKNRRRIDALELELLKLKRRLSESE